VDAVAGRSGPRTRNGTPSRPAELLLDRLDRDPDLAVVRPPRQVDELELRRPRQQEVGVDRDAVAADPEARLVDVRVRAASSRRDHLVDVDAGSLSIPGELVGEGDVHVAVRRVGELAELAASALLIATISVSRTAS
jgi:hypothetical protein